MIKWWRHYTTPANQLFLCQKTPPNQSGLKSTWSPLKKKRNSEKWKEQTKVMLLQRASMLFHFSVISSNAASLKFSYVHCWLDFIAVYSLPCLFMFPIFFFLLIRYLQKTPEQFSERCEPVYDMSKRNRLFIWKINTPVGNLFQKFEHVS